MNDPYEVCRYVRHYHQKNGYAPRREQLSCDPDFFDKLVANGVLQVLPLHEGGPPVGVVLTEKGARMADGRTSGRGPRARRPRG